MTVSLAYMYKDFFKNDWIIEYNFLICSLSFIPSDID